MIIEGGCGGNWRSEPRRETPEEKAAREARERLSALNAELQAAVGKGDIETIMRCVEGGADVKATAYSNYRNQSLAAVACAAGHYAAATLLRELGADTANDKDVLQGLLLQRIKEKKRGDVEALLQRGFADVNAAVGNHTPLSYAISEYTYDIVDFLVQQGADIAPGKRNATLRLIEECARGRDEAITPLLRAGADIDAVGESDCPIGRAAQYGHIRILQKLVESGADVNRKGGEGNRTPLMRAAAGGHDHIVDYLLLKGADPLLNANGLPRNMVHQGTPLYKKLSVDILLDREGMQLLSPDRLMLNRDIGGGTVIQEIYDFSARDRVVMFREGVTGEVIDRKHESFASVEDRAYLRKVFGFYAARGGTVTEAEAFSLPIAGKPRRPVLGE